MTVSIKHPWNIFKQLILNVRKPHSAFLRCAHLNVMPTSLITSQISTKVWRRHSFVALQSRWPKMSTKHWHPTLLQAVTFFSILEVVSFHLSPPSLSLTLILFIIKNSLAVITNSENVHHLQECRKLCVIYLSLSWAGCHLLWLILRKYNNFFRSQWFIVVVIKYKT